MSQLVEEPIPVSPVHSRERTRPVEPVDENLNEFSYQPVPVLAVVGTALAVVSSVAVFIWLVLPVCLVALLLSTIALWNIRRSQGVYGGTKVALAGMVISFSSFVGGIAFQVYAFQTELPEGYERVSFVKEISTKGFVEEDGVSRVHPDVESLDGKKIFLKGYIYQTGRTKDLASFLLVKDNADCCFGANPAITDRVGVVMQDGKTIDYHAGKVAIAGTFRLNPNFDPTGELEPLYIVDGELFATRVSDF